MSVKPGLRRVAVLLVVAVAAFLAGYYVGRLPRENFGQRVVRECRELMRATWPDQSEASLEVDIKLCAEQRGRSSTAPR